MIRFLAILVGLGFLSASSCSFINGFGTWVSTPTEPTAEHRYHLEPEKVSFASDGLFGRFDRAQLQRGFQVYSQVCSSCHSLSLVAFRNLGEIGYSEAEIAKIAHDFGEKAKQPVQDPKTGTWDVRDNVPADHFPRIYYSGTGSPPDLSLVTKAREGGAHYVHSLLTGYQDAPADVQVPEGLYYNPYFANLNIAMPPPLASDGQVQYADGTAPTVDQMAQDVSAFLVWAAEPNLETRHSVGIAVVIFLALATLLAFFAYKSVWADKKPKKKKAARADI